MVSKSYRKMAADAGRHGRNIVEPCVSLYHLLDISINKVISYTESLNWK